MSAHTPGPWWKDVHDNIKAPGGIMVATAWGSDDRPSKANGRLIAAAPEMLKLIENVAHSDQYWSKEAKELIQKIEGVK